MRKPDVAEQESDNKSDSGLLACAADLISAVHSKDEQGVASAMRAAFELLESEPHEEAEHDDSNEQESE